jgi:predicted amidohydrolase
MRSFRLAALQMRVEGGRKQENLQRALEWVARAADAGAQIAVLPEALDVGWTHPACRQEAEPIPDGSACLRLREAARRHRLYLCAGLSELAEGAVFNAAVLLGPDGSVLLHHRKLNELEIGHHCYGQGDRLGVAHTPLAAFGLMICADGFAPGQMVSRTLGLMGAQVILSPCAWAVPADHDNLREPYGQLWLDNYGPVAGDFRLWIAGVSNVGWITEGPWKGRQCIGCSLLVGPDGKEVLRGPYGHDAETILYADVTPLPRPARADGWSAWWKGRAKKANVVSLADRPGKTPARQSGRPRPHNAR